MRGLATQPCRLGSALAQGAAMSALRQPGEKATQQNSDDDRHDKNDKQRRLDRTSHRRGERIEGDGDNVAVRNCQGYADDRERQQNQHFQKAFHLQDFIYKTRGCDQLR